jgi:hypothetical protein
MMRNKVRIYRGFLLAKRFSKTAQYVRIVAGPIFLNRSGPAGLLNYFRRLKSVVSICQLSESCINDISSVQKKRFIYSKADSKGGGSLRSEIGPITEFDFVFPILSF